jgi:hypothetical protein
MSAVGLGCAKTISPRVRAHDCFASNALRASKDRQNRALDLLLRADQRVPSFHTGGSVTTSVACPPLIQLRTRPSVLRHDGFVRGAV